MSISRRDLLKLTTAAALAGAMPLSAVAAERRKNRRGVPVVAARKIPLGLQLYSVRQQCEKDLPAVLKAVAAMGYQGVEFAGYYGRKAEEIKKLLDENKLVCCGTHIGMDTLKGDKWKETVAFNKTLGNKFLIVSWIDPKQMETEAAVKEIAKQFTDLAAKGKAEGMRVGYHAHGGDFNKVGDKTAWEILFSNAGPEVCMQLDIGNCLDGKGNPYKMLEEFPGRSATIHLKEHGGKPGAPVGEGDIDWKRVFQLCETTGKTEWYIVEHESSDKPLEAVKQCIDNLRKMGK
jgi:sugar phosphate isomerase/epimerase